MAPILFAWCWPLVQLKSFTSKKTSSNFIKSIFIALKTQAACFKGATVLNAHTGSIFSIKTRSMRALTLLVLTGTIIVATPQVESEFNFTRTLETINVIPSSISGNGWENVDSLYEHDVREDALFQAFSIANSAYPTAKKIESSGDASDKNLDDTAERAHSETGTLIEDNSPIESLQGDGEDIPSGDPDTETETVGEDVPVDQVLETTVQEDRDGIFGFFRAITGMMPFVQESVFETRGEEPSGEETQSIADLEAGAGTFETHEEENAPLQIDDVVSDSDALSDEVGSYSDDASQSDTENTEDDTARALEPIVMRNFGIPQLESGQFITNVQLRMSLAAQVSIKDIIPNLTIEYSLGDNWEEAGVVILENEVSNALNGGHFLFALPTVQNEKTLTDLAIRIRVVGELAQEDTLLIDAVWLEIDTEIFDKELLRERLLPDALTGLALPTMHEVLSDTLDFTREDDPLFVLRYESQRSATIRFVRSLFGRSLAEVANVTLIRKDVGIVNIEPVIAMTNDGLWTIQIPEEARENLEPGTYTIEITVDEGGKLFMDTLDFQWGLLALNPNKTEYAIGETATIALAALTPGGNTLCDANLVLYIIDPADFMYRAPITPSGLCNGNNVIDIPDYSAVFTPTIQGEYEMYLEHIGDDGEVRAHTIDTFKVTDAQTLSIEREGQTRIYPRAPYTMALTVRSTDGYVGTLIEPVPPDFTILETDGRVVGGITEQHIQWELDIAPGESTTVSYAYDAPDISPFLYTLGPARLTGVPAQAVVTEQSLATTSIDVPVDESIPLSEDIPIGEEAEETFLEEPVPESPEILITDEVNVIPEGNEPPSEESIEVVPQTENNPEELFETILDELPTVQASVTEADTRETTSAFAEHRAWQIASDATGSMIVFWTDGATIPSGWTCISCASTSTFYQRFPLGGATYGTTGGIPTTTHTADGSINASTLASSENNAGTGVAISSHAHTLTPAVASTTTLPAYRQLRVIQNNSAGTPGTIPAGAVLIFDTTPPSGWAQYTPLDDRYPRGENTIVSSSTNTHIHTVTGTTSTSSGSTVNNRAGGTQATPLPAIASHTHTLSASTSPVSHEPPYLQVIFATSSVATATPLSALAMWSDTPPAGWLDRSSGVADPFYNRYIKGGSTYGTTGGSDTHTHGNFSASSSAASANTAGRTGATGASSAHTHIADISNFSSASNTPPYVTVIFGKYFGLVPIYTQTAYQWYVNTNSTIVSDPWPTSTADVAENEAIDASFTPLKNGDVIRLRLQLTVQNSTTTGEDFKLQYGTTTTNCSAVSPWADVGAPTSSLPWVGYDNSTPSDGATLGTSRLTGTDIFESYEEQNPTVVLPNSIGIGQDGEWDFVLKQNNALPNTNYCFRMVKSDGSALFGYTQYPLLVTNDAPSVPTLDTPFNNEKAPSTTPQFTFSASDPEADDLTYQIQIDDDYTFASVNVDRNTASNPTQFANLTTPADKDPYTNGELVRFSLPPASALTNGITYYWRVRANDPNGSNSTGSWSTSNSLTVDTTATTTAWFQTTEEQFDTGTLEGVDALVTDRIQLNTGSSTGTTTSSQIDFLDGTVGNAWGSLVFNDDETVGDIKYRVQYFDQTTQSWTFVSDTDLSSNSTGFDTSPVSLLSLDTDTYRYIRLLAIFTNVGGTPSLFDWSVVWGYRITTVTQSALFPNEKSGTTTPTFIFSTSDPQSDDLVYQIQWSTTSIFTASTTRSSDVNSGFTNRTNGGDTSPFTSGNSIGFTIQPVDVLTNGTTYWWRVRARDPLGANQFSLWTDVRSFTIDTAVTVSTWFQTTQSQFDTNVLSGTQSVPSGSVTVATTSSESLIVYAEGNITTPRYRSWNGSTWGTETSALDVGAAINWIVTESSPTRNEYITGTLGTDADVNLQVFKNGSWGNLQEVTASIANTNMRGFDIAYEQSSGDALVVYCDGDANPSYYVWNGTSWTSSGGIGLLAGNTCGWVKLISDPLSDEIIAVTRDTTGLAYEARVWSGSSWGNSQIWGSMNQATHEGIAAEYEDSGNQAVVAVSNGTNANFTWRAWDGATATWTIPTTVALGDDFEAGTLSTDRGTDNMALCYVDEDGDIGVSRWTGAAFNAFTEFFAGWNTAGGIYNDRPIDCAFEVGGSRDGYINAVFSTTTAIASSTWTGAAWSTQRRVSSFGPSVRVQLRRTGTNILQAVAYASTTDRYDFASWDGTSWSTLQTLETDASVGATPFKEPFMMAERKPGITGSAVVSPAINFYNGSGPYWQQLAWSDSEPSGSTILYQIEYYNSASSSWQLVPNTLIPGNSSGTTTSPINLTNVLPVSTYSLLRPVANLTCNLGTCPTLSDWTLTWAAGISISGTAQAYDQIASTTSGTVAVALNGVLQAGKTGTISGGSWSIANVNAAPGDVVSVFIDGAGDANEAVALARYDGVGDISGMNLYERHITLGSNDATSTPFSNTNLGLYDTTNDEDLFYDVTGTTLTTCGDVACGDVEILIKSGSIYQPQGTTSTHDIEINGTVRPEGNTLNVSGSWDNNATNTSATSTIIFTATSSIEFIDETGALTPSFYNLTFGTTTGSATWNASTSLDINNVLTLTRGIFARGTTSLTIGGNFSIGASGTTTGIGTTTFDGTGTSVFTDSTTNLQNIGRVLIDGTSKTLQLGSAARFQSLTIGLDDIFDVSTSNYGLTILTNFLNNNTFVSRNGTTTFAGTTTSLTITTGGSAFYNLAFTGASGAWAFTGTDVSIQNDLTIATGTLTLPSGTTTISGSFTNTTGTFAHNNGTVIMNSGTAESLTLAGGVFTNAFFNLRFDGSGSWTFTETQATTSNDFRIAQGTVTFPSGTLTVIGNFANTLGTFNANTGTVKFSGTQPKTIDTNASFYNMLFTRSTTTSFIDTSVIALEDVTVSSGTVLFPSTLFTIGGSLTNTASITPNGGTVLLNSSDTGETVQLGVSSLNNLTINSGTGGWTISQHATTTSAFTLTSAGSFTLAPGQTLSVGGVFTNSVGGASTTWTGSILSLEAGAYTVNTKTNTGDSYGTLQVKANTDIQMWNSTSTNYSVNGTGSLYSQDHNSVDGELYIFGGYERATGTEYWNATTDFDGVSLATTSRPVTVRLASGASVSLSSSTLSVQGTSTATTTIRNQGTGSYTISVSGGTTTMQYYDIADLGLSGVTLTGATKVTTMNNGRFIPSTNSGTGISVTAQTIDANPGLQVFFVNFSTTSAITVTNVSQTGGFPTSYWWFRNATGTVDGEFYDSDTGNPGSIRWDDSSLIFNISGTVYNTDGVTTLGAPTCGAGTPIRAVVQGGATYVGSCNGSGAYTIPSVVAVGDTILTVYLSGAAGGEKAVAVVKTPTADITNLDLIVNRVIVRNQDVTPVTIADMASLDSTDTSDIFFTAATGTTNTLTVQANNALMVWASSIFTPGGSVTLQSGGTGNAYDGSLYLGSTSTFTGAGTTTYSVGGSFTVLSGATFIPASSTVVMTATTTGKGITASGSSTINFNTVNFTGVGGGWNLTGNMSLTGDLSLATGTLTATGNITLINGSMSGNGLFSQGTGTTTLTVGNTLGGSQAWTFGNLMLGTGSVTGTTSKATTATTTVLGQLTISAGHFFQVYGSVLELRGSGTVFIENGTFVESTSTVRYSGTSNTNVLSTGYYNLLLSALGGSPTYTGTGLGIVVQNAFTVGGVSTTTVTLDASDPALDVNGDVIITSNGTLVGSNSALMTVAGNWTNSGTYTGSGGTVTIDTPSTSNINPGNSSFSNLTINASGSVTISTSATSTGVFTLTTASTFTQNSGTTLAVGGTFVNALGGGSTVWTNATLYLYGGGNYQINASTTNDVYSKLTVGANTQIRMWNSSASTTDLASTASLYSQDHANVDGSLYIFGAYVKTSGNDYWSYATDFDGTQLGVSPRQVSVRIASSSSVLYTGGGLSVTGVTNASTTIQNQGSGAYALRIGGSASTTFSYYTLTNTDINGLTFSGTPTVVNLSNGNFTVSTASGTAMTVGGTVLDQNPAKTFTTNVFGTSTSGLAFNVTATGTSISSWRFTNHTGSIAGETYDVDPNGDPGYIVWDNSASNITVSGRVYSDEGSSVSGICNGSSNVITLRVAGLTTYTSSCAPGTGQYSMSGVTYSPGDSLIAYIDGTTTKGAAVTEDPTTNIGNLDIYENRVILRHESSDPLSILDTDVWDGDNDADIPFTATDASPDTLVVPANRKLLIWTGKTFLPGGNVTVTGNGTGASFDGSLELYSNAVFDATGAESHTVGGSLTMGAGATLDSETSTFTFTSASTSRTIDTNDQNFHSLTLNGAGSWLVTNTTLTVGGNLTITQGSTTLPSATTTVSGSFLNTGGSFNQNNGWMYFSGSGARSIRTGTSTFGTTTFTGSGSWTYLGTNSTSTGPFTILSGTVGAPTGTLAVGGNFINRGIFTNNSGTLRMTSAVSSTTINASTSDLANVTIAGTGTFVFTDPTEALSGSLTLLSGTTTLPTSTLSIGGSLVSSGGAFIHATGTVLFNSSDTGETITPGNSTFTNLTLASPAGGWTITGNATTTGNFTLSSASQFTLQNGQTLGVQGVFTNLVGGTSTTWTGTRVNILSGTSYTVNSKSQGGDTYNIIILGNNSDLRLWNSVATTSLSDTLSSLYSQDNAGVDGELYIYGNYSRSTGADYWSAATDFDGTSIATTTRPVTVRHANGATSTFAGGAIDIVGTALATTTITNQGSGTYSLHVTGGTINAQNYAIRNINTFGLVLSGNTTVTSIAQGDFELAVSGGTLITLSSTTLSYNASAVISGMRFATTTAITGVNVALVGTTSASWTFTSHRGNLDGEALDSDGIDDCGSIRWSDSTCLLTEEVGYRWRNDDGGEGVPNSEWYDTNWSKRTRVTITNADATTYTNAVVEVTVPYDSDMQTDFDDLRVTGSNGISVLDFTRETYTASTEATLWIEIPSLSASTDTTVYLYYGNGGATYAGSGTSTFVVYDDFEDDDIAEYSGDSSLFNVGTGFAYQGTYGLDAVGNVNSQTSDGIYRTSAVVSQGETIRYFQYISSAGTLDEVCTLFGVQSPGSNNNNYAVCLEQVAGIDRMSIAENVQSSDSSGTAVILASTTVAYSPGWYEVEIKWGTNNTILATLYNSADAFVASTSVTDSSYTTGGIGFAYWFQNGGWDYYTSRELLSTEPTVALGFEQVSGGASWASLYNTPVSGVNTGTVVRPRFVIQNTGLTVSDQYRLMYAAKGVSPSCEAVGAGSYLAVPIQASCGTSPICIQSSSGFTNGALTTDVLGGEGTFTQGSLVEDPSNTTGAISLDANEYTEVEYAIGITINATDPAYCLRVSDAGTSIDSYTKVAELGLVFAPNITSITFNNGANITLSPGATTTIYATGTVTDQNGYADIIAATTTMFRSGVGASCTLDTNSCYIAGPSACSYVNCSGNSCDIACRSDFYYFADPTDSVSAFAAQSWGAELSVRDQSGLMATQTAPYIDLLTLRALTASNTINYGSLAVNSDTGSFNASTTFINYGNSSIDILVQGTNLTDGVSSIIPVNEQKYATSTFTYSSCVYCNQLSASSTTYELDLFKPTTTSSGVTDQVYWGIQIPFGVSANAHTGSNVFYATGD